MANVSLLQIAILACVVSILAGKATSSSSPYSTNNTWKLLKRVSGDEHLNPTHSKSPNRTVENNVAAEKSPTLEAASVPKRVKKRRMTFAPSKDNPQQPSVRKVTPLRNSGSGGEEEVRQYGGGFGGGPGGYYGSGGYDLYTLIAVAAFAALFGALFFQLASNGSILRSLDGPPSFAPFPSAWPFSLSSIINSPQMTDLVAQVSDAVSGINWEQVIRNTTGTVQQSSRVKRALRAVGEKTGMFRWVRAYKNDPVGYSCVRKVACETLAESPLIANSMRSSFGNTLLSTLGFFMEHGDELQNVVRTTVGHPEICRNMAPVGLCDD